MELDLRVIDVAANILLLSVSGKVKSGEVDPLEASLQRLCLGPPARLILDVHAVDSVDSSGMGVLIRGRNDIVTRGGKVVLIGVTDRVSMIIRISGLENYFQIASTRDEAIAMLREKPAE
ncbi:MAG TPA: STAS domain-containing protein [Acidobacteriota bacterium]|nr:STAS domain-containing protein [Acidobacteriota bacterium]